jgi:hypothetical protein
MIFVKTLYNIITNENVDIVLCNYSNYYPNGTFQKGFFKSLGDSDEIKVKNIDDNPKLLEINCLWTSIFNKDFILDKGIKFDEDIISEGKVFLGS